MLSREEIQEMINRLDKSDHKDKEKALKVYRDLLKIEDESEWYRELLDLYIEGKFEELSEKVKYYKENYPDFNIDIIEFNLMLHDGKHNTMECYAWLYEQKNKREEKFYQENGFRYSLDFNYLYPELICAKNFENEQA
jgi:hypothetical protein